MDTRAEGYENLRAKVHRIKIDKNTDELIDLYNAGFSDNMSSMELGMSQEDRVWRKKAEGSVRIEDGHYQLALLFRDEDPKMPNNRQMAERRLAYLKKKMNRNTKFDKNYTVFMDALIQEGHAEKIPEEDLQRKDQKVWFIPHHVVYHPRKPAKIRLSLTPQPG